jgi:hypothetical protein
MPQSQNEKSKPFQNCNTIVLIPARHAVTEIIETVLQTIIQRNSLEKKTLVVKKKGLNEDVDLNKRKEENAQRACRGLSKQ